MVNDASGSYRILGVYRKIVIMERLFKSGVITTVAGLIILIGAVYMYLSKSFNSVESGELAALGLLFLRSKDSLIGINDNKKGSKNTPS